MSILVGTASVRGRWCSSSSEKEVDDAIATVNKIVKGLDQLGKDLESEATNQQIAEDLSHLCLKCP